MDSTVYEYRYRYFIRNYTKLAGNHLAEVMLPHTYSISIVYRTHEHGPHLTGHGTHRWCMARTLPNFCVVLYIFCVVPFIFVLFYVFIVLCRSLYCLCVYVYCTTATGWLPNCSLIYHIISTLWPSLFLWHLMKRWKYVQISFWQL
jgi:hypothetical protein